MLHLSPFTLHPSPFLLYFTQHNHEDTISLIQFTDIAWSPGEPEHFQIHSSGSNTYLPVDLPRYPWTYLLTYLPTSKMTAIQNKVQIRNHSSFWALQRILHCFLHQRKMKEQHNQHLRFEDMQQNFQAHLIGLDASFLPYLLPPASYRNKQATSHTKKDQNPKSPTHLH